MGDTSFSHEIKLGNIDKLNVNGNYERFQMLLDCYCCHYSCPCSRMLSFKHAVLPVGQPPTCCIRCACTAVTEAVPYLNNLTVKTM